MRFGVFVINLDQDVARRAFMTRELAAVGLAFERYPAVRGTDLPAWLRPWFLTPEGAPVPTLKPGEIGVYASHLDVHRLLLERGLDAALVLEDDVRVTPRLQTFLAHLDELPPDFDLIRLSNPIKGAFVAQRAFGPDVELVAYARVPTTTGCYLISRAGAEKTTRFQGIRTRPVDVDWQHPWESDLRTYGITPPPTEANVLEGSSIDLFGPRALRQRSVWQKARERRRESPQAFLRRLVWQIRFLGARPWLACQARAAFWRLRRLFPGADRLACLRVEGRSGRANAAQVFF